MPALPDGNTRPYRELRRRVEIALSLNDESPSVEFKAGLTWPSLRGKLIRTILAMSNLRDGGLIVVGRSQDPGLADGITSEFLATYDPDVMRDQVDIHADPRAAFSSVKVTIGAFDYVAIEVSEFETYPVICARALQPELKAGSIYIRPNTMRPRTISIATAEQMRDLIELAIDKGVADFERRAARRGFVKRSSDAQAYDAELHGGN